MPITFRHGSGVTARGMAGAENPTITCTSDPEVTTSGSVASVTVNDANLSRDTAADTRSRYRCEANFEGASAPVYASSNESVATVDDHGITSYVGAGTAIITATTNRGTVGESLTFSTATGTTVDTLASWVTGSLAAECAANIDGAISGATPATAKPIFTTQSPSTSTYVRNSSCWAADWVEALTCISPWNSHGAGTRAGVAITPRHILMAVHYPVNNGSTIRFIGSDGAVYDRTLAAVVNHPSYSSYYPDIAIATLSSDLPAAITPCKLAPADLGDKFGNIGYGIPMLVLDQEEKALIADLYRLDIYAYGRTPTDAARLGLHEELINGDSGNPSFLKIGDDLVLISVHTSGGGGIGTFVGGHLSAIDTMIATADAAAGISSGLTATVADLSSYPTY